MTFPADRRIRTRFGVHDVDVQLREDGQVVARLAQPDEHPRLSAVVSAFGEDEDQAVERLTSAIERFGADPPAQPRPPVR